MMMMYVLMAAVVCISCVAQDRRTALIWAAERGHTETVRALLAAGADTNLQNMVSASSSVAVDDECSFLCNIYLKFFYFKHYAYFAYFVFSQARLVCTLRTLRVQMKPPYQLL